MCAVFKDTKIDSKSVVDALDRSLVIIEFDPVGRVISANANFCALFGYEVSDIIGRHHSMFVEPDYVPSADYAAFWEQLGRGEFDARDYKRVGRNGKEVWIQASYNPIFDSNNNVVKVVTFATDITNRILAPEYTARGLSQPANAVIFDQIEDACDPDFERLRSGIHLAIDQLRLQISAAPSVTQSVGRSEDIAAAASDLSRRTEQQAESLRDTEAALYLIAAIVKRSAEGARQAGAAVAAAKADAMQSGSVTTKPGATLGEIEKSAERIDYIIGAIDEIALQTDISAVGAGDAGQGFAVVAQEMRTVAQRSAFTAKKIKSLVASRAKQIQRGASLVRDTGQALSAIVASVTQIDALISAMAQSSLDDAKGLSAVNAAMSQMDQMTQQNATMVEEATGAVAVLKSEADTLAALVGRLGASDQSSSLSASTARSTASTVVHLKTRRAAYPRGPEGQRSRREGPPAKIAFLSPKTLS